MTEDANIRDLPCMEIFMVRGKLVATQRAYTFPYMKETFREVRYYYCGKCGEVWGTRTMTGENIHFHKYYRHDCQSCGGEEEMLSPFEWAHLSILGESVLAHHFLTLAQEGNENETQKCSSTKV